MIRALLTIAIMVHSFLAYAHYAHAKTTINDEGAAHLKSMFQSIIDEHQSFMKASKKSELILKGELSVEKEDTYYAITLPHASINYADNKVLKIGIISINVQPHEEESNQWKITLALPTPLKLSDTEKNKLIFSMDIARQKFSGIWHEDIQHFTKLDASYKDITISTPTEQIKFSIPNATILYDIEKDQDDLWSGPMQVVLENAKITNTGDNGETSLEKLTMDINLSSYDPLAIKRYKNEIKAQTSTSSTLIDLLTTMGAGYETNYSLKNLDISFNEKTKEEGSEVQETLKAIHLGSANIGFNISGFSTDKAKIGFNMGYSDLKAPETDAGYNTIAPTTGNIEIALDNIPFLQLTNLGKETMQDIETNPEMAQMSGLLMLMKAPAFLSQAGTTLTINDNHVSNDSYKIFLNGTAKADITAKNSATVDASIIINNMNWLLGEIEKQKTRTGKEPTGFFKGTLGILEIVKDLVQESVSTDGSPAHIFHIIMGKDGKMMINGLDIRAFMGDKAIQNDQPEQETNMPL